MTARSRVADRVASGPINVAVGASRTTYASTASTGSYRHANVGASYSTQLITFFGLFNQVTVDLTGGTIRKNTSTVGAHVSIVPAGVLRLSYSRLADHSSASLLNADGSARSSNAASQWALGYVHNLSKRTALYGTYSRLSNRGKAAYTVSGAPTPIASRGARGIEAGVRHQF
ncbi:porin [Variovorax sp. WS11]|uniref:porin n=1 Tax=Variovorax sp. WS11 TaxID=1105204 RepID=UPI0023B31B08|nr:porin [Variovorax sp. WS11]